MVCSDKNDCDTKIMQENINVSFEKDLFKLMTYQQETVC